MQREHPVDAGGIAELGDVLGIGRRQLERRFRADIGLSPAGYRQTLRLERGRWLLQNTDLSVMDNLEVGRQRPRRWPDGTAAPEWMPEKLFALFPNLGEMPQRPGGRMSGGEQQMLTVARTLMGQPLLVLLDEPSEGVAPLIVQQMARTIRALKAQGVSVLLSEQNLPFAEAVADRAYLIEQGEVVHEGSMADVVANPDVRKNCLGV